MMASRAVFSKSIKIYIYICPYLLGIEEEKEEKDDEFTKLIRLSL